MKSAVVGLGLLLWGMGMPGWAADLYFLRHAQTVANATDHYTDETERQFSEEGWRQIGAVTSRLAGLHFDTILVSPKYRVTQTILPYLMAQQRRAEIWPELGECCWQGDLSLPPSRAVGDPIVIEPGQELYFYLRAGAMTNEYPAETFGDGTNQVRIVCDLLRRYMAEHEESVLIVGHFLTSSCILNEFLGRPMTNIIRLKNGALTHLHERPDGAFELLMLNDRPLTNRPVLAPAPHESK